MRHALAANLIHVEGLDADADRYRQHLLHVDPRFDLVRSGGRNWLRPTADAVNGPGAVSALDPSRSDIHRVVCVSTEPTVSVHVYGADLTRTGTSIKVSYDDALVGDHPPLPRARGRIARFTCEYGARLVDADPPPE